MSSQHSPLPWVVGPMGDLIAADGFIVGDTWVSGHRRDAELIVRCVNVHAELLEALKAITDACEADCGGEITDDCGDDESVGAGPDYDMALTFGMIRRAKAAIAKAEAQ